MISVSIRKVSSACPWSGCGAGRDCNNANCVFNVPPDNRGRIPRRYVETLMKVQEKWEILGVG
jgi:hypothetical protein